MLQKTEGVILHSIAYQDYDQILTVFTFDFGVIKLIVKGANRPKHTSGGVPSLFTRVQCVFVQGRGDIGKCQELSVLQPYLKLRGTLAGLQAASDMAQALRNSQPAHHPNPHLYLLFVSYLGQLSRMKDPFFLAISFRLKMLYHEGFYCGEAEEMKQLLTFRTYAEVQECVVSNNVRSEVLSLFQASFS